MDPNWKSTLLKANDCVESKKDKYQRNFNSYLKPVPKTVIQWLTLDLVDGKLPDDGGIFRPVSAKHILRYLQQVQLVGIAVPENTWVDADGRPAQFTCPLEVSMPLGGQTRVFNLMDKRRLKYPARYDLYVQTHNKDFPGTVACPKFEDMVKYLHHHTKVIVMKRAELILDALCSASCDKQKRWEDAIAEDGSPLFGTQEIRAAVELIAATHVTDCTPRGSPSTSVHPGTGVPCSEKLARAVLRKIAAGETTFQEAFCGEEALYIPARPNGKEYINSLCEGTSDATSNNDEVLINSLSDHSDVE